MTMQSGLIKTILISNVYSILWNISQGFDL